MAWECCEEGQVIQELLEASRRSDAGFSFEPGIGVTCRADSNFCGAHICSPCLKQICTIRRKIQVIHQRLHIAILNYQQEKLLRNGLSDEKPPVKLPCRSRSFAGLCSKAFSLRAAFNTKGSIKMSGIRNQLRKINFNPVSQGGNCLRGFAD